MSESDLRPAPLRSFALVPVAVSFVFLAAVGEAQEDTDLEAALQRCVETTGAPFANARDDALRVVDRSFLKRKLEHPDWRQRVTAQILLSWQLHGPYFRELLDSPVEEDRLGGKHYAWARRPGALKPSSVYLMHEILLKGGKPNRARSDAATALIDLRRRGKPVNPGAVMETVRDPRIDDESVRRSAALVLSKIPLQRSAVSSESLLTLAEKEKDPAVAKLVLGALGNRARTETEKREEIVGKLLTYASLGELTGRRSVLQTAARIGGQKALEAVEKHLRDPETAPTSQRWALDTLADMPEEKAAAVVAEYVQSDRKLLRRTAIAGLGRCQYSGTVVEALESVLKEQKFTIDERRRSLASFDRLHRQLLGSGDVERANGLSERLIETEKEVEDEELKGQINSLLKLLQTRKTS